MARTSYRCSKSPVEAAGRDDAVGRLQAVVDALDPDEGDGEVKELVDELENAISEAEGVDFPGMY